MSEVRIGRQNSNPLAGRPSLPTDEGRYGVVAFPGADRIANGEEWLQTNTLGRQKATILPPGQRASYFQELARRDSTYPLLANPKIIMTAWRGISAAPTRNLTGFERPYTVAGHESRPTHEPHRRMRDSTAAATKQLRVYQMLRKHWRSDGEDFESPTCDATEISPSPGFPTGIGVTVFDQWNDVTGGRPLDARSSPDRGQYGSDCMNQWQANIYTKSFIDLNHEVFKTMTKREHEPGSRWFRTNIRSATAATPTSKKRP